MASRDLLRQSKGALKLVQDTAGMGLGGVCVLLPPEEITFLLAFSQPEGL